MVTVVGASTCNRNTIPMTGTLSRVNYCTFNITATGRTIILHGGNVGGPVLVLKCIFPRSCSSLVGCRVVRTMFRCRATGTLSSRTMGLKGATGVRVGLSANVNEVKVRPASRDVRRVGGVCSLPGVRVGNVFARFTYTSRRSGASYGGRGGGCLSFIKGLSGTKIRVPVGRVYGSTKVVRFSSGFLSVMEDNVVACKLCPSRRMSGSGLRLRPTLRLGDRVTCVGSIKPNFAIDCNDAFASGDGVHVTAMPMNCNSKCPETLSGGNGILVRNGFTSVVNEIYVSRFVISIASVPRTGRNSRMALVNGSRGGMVAMRSITSGTRDFGCRFYYKVGHEIPHICCGSKGCLRAMSCLS